MCLDTSISPRELQSRKDADVLPVVVDVRRQPAYDADDAVIPGAVRGAPEALADWSADLPADGEIVVYCVHGHEVSQGAAQALRDRGFRARFLAGGIAGWREAGGATAPKTTAGKIA